MGGGVVLVEAEVTWLVTVLLIVVLGEAEGTWLADVLLTAVPLPAP